MILVDESSKVFFTPPEQGPEAVGSKRNNDKNSSLAKKPKTDIVSRVQIPCCCGCTIFDPGDPNDILAYRHYCYSGGIGSRKPVFGGFCLHGNLEVNFSVDRLVTSR